MEELASKNLKFSISNMKSSILKKGIYFFIFILCNSFYFVINFIFLIQKDFEKKDIQSTLYKCIPLRPGIRVHLKRMCIYRIHINLYDINLKLR